MFQCWKQGISGIALIDWSSSIKKYIHRYIHSINMRLWRILQSVFVFNANKKKKKHFFGIAHFLGGFYVFCFWQGQQKMNTCLKQEKNVGEKHEILVNLFIILFLLAFSIMIWIIFFQNFRKLWYFECKKVLKKRNI